MMRHVCVSSDHASDPYVKIEQQTEMYNTLYPKVSLSISPTGTAADRNAVQSFTIRSSMMIDSQYLVGVNVTVNLAIHR